MKNFLEKTAIRIILFVVLFMSTIAGVTNILSDNTSIKKNKEFFAQKEDFDILFFGSSHTEIFINPMDLWKEYGIVSYNFGAPEEGIAVSYAAMKNAISVHKPKLIVFDVSMYGRGDIYSNDERLHFALDSYPLSNIKIETINELLSDNNQKLEMIFKIGKYHNRWKNLTKSDFDKKNVFIKGNLSYGMWETMRVNSFHQNELSDEIAELDKESMDYQYIQKIIDLCRDNEIELLMMVTPFVCDKGRQELIHGVQEMSENQGITFLNLIDNSSMIDMKVDMYDLEHVNQSGLHKVSDYLGSYLVSKYDLNDYREDSRYANWNDDYNSYKDTKYDSIWWMADRVDVMLETLHDKDIESIVFVGKNANTKVDKELFINLIQNISRDNITVNDEQYIKSEEISNLMLIDDAVGYEDYLTVNRSGKAPIEITGEDAILYMKTQNPDINISSDNIGVIIIDKETNAVKMIRVFSNNEVSWQEFFY